MKQRKDNQAKSPQERFGEEGDVEDVDNVTDVHLRCWSALTLWGFTTVEELLLHRQDPKVLSDCKAYDVTFEQVLAEAPNWFSIVNDKSN